MSESQPAVATTTLPCSVCRAPQEAMDGNPDVPYGANIFASHGHYGATAYDTPGGEHLELLICTGCLDTIKATSAIHRVLHATAATEESRNLWDSDDDPAEDNPKNKQRLRNEFAMETFLETTQGMTQERAGRIFKACHEASREGKVFEPLNIPANPKEELTDV